MKFLFSPVVLTLCLLTWNCVSVLALYTYCSSPHGEIQDVDVSGCKNSDKICIFHKGKDVILNIRFLPRYNSLNVKVNIFGMIGGVPVPFPVNPAQACGNYGFDCPLKYGKSTNFRLTLPIKNAYPPVAVKVLIKLVDEAERNVICLYIPAKIE